MDIEAALIATPEARERYLNDPWYHRVVDSACAVIRSGGDPMEAIRDGLIAMSREIGRCHAAELDRSRNAPEPIYWFRNPCGVFGHHRTPPRD